jgi:uncharacterized protein (UPF0276 family)
MYIVNITFSVENSILGAWLEYMQKSVLPYINEITYADEPLYTRIMQDVPHADHSYSVQVPIENPSDVKKFEEEALEEIIRMNQLAFPEKVHLFKTILKKVQ